MGDHGCTNETARDREKKKQFEHRESVAHKLFREEYFSSEDDTVVRSGDHKDSIKAQIN